MRNLCSVLIGAVIFSAPALAADMPVKAQPMAPVYSWTGFYVGGHAGYAWTTQNMSATDRAAITATYGAVPSPKGFVGGLHAGYDYQLANRVVVGLGLEVNGFGVDAVNNTTGIAPGSSLKSTIDWDFTVFGRVGYAFDRFLPYVLLGGAWDHNKTNGFNGFIGPFSVNVWHTGWTVGAGVEMPIANHWTGRVQYRFVDSDTQTYLNRQISGTGSIIDVGISYRF
jgi:opacity protein-like surface antigen